MDKSKHGNLCSICEFLGQFLSVSQSYTCRLQQLQVGAAKCRLMQLSDIGKYMQKTVNGIMTHRKQHN